MSDVAMRLLMLALLVAMALLLASAMASIEDHDAVTVFVDPDVIDRVWTIGDVVGTGVFASDATIISVGGGFGVVATVVTATARCVGVELGAAVSVGVGDLPSLG